MKTSTIITIIVIILIAIAGIYFLTGNSETESSEGDTELENTDNSEFPDLDSDEATLNELDSILEELE
jgi:flagellar basal body-associated protein FliL